MNTNLDNWSKYYQANLNEDAQMGMALPYLILESQDIDQEIPALGDEDQTETAEQFVEQSEEDDDNIDEEEIDELLMEVQKELFTRFKNMFESDMLLPNLGFNPEFEEKVPEDKTLLNLEDEAPKQNAEIDTVNQEL